MMLPGSVHGQLNNPDGYFRVRADARTAFVAADFFPVMTYWIRFVDCG
jgi:hypothetical protein